MAFRWGCTRWGTSTWGGQLALGLKSIALPGVPPSALISWTPHPSTPASIVWQVYVNGRLVTVTTATQYVVVLEEIGRFHFEVIGVRAGQEGTDNRGCLETIPGDRAKLSWSDGARWGRFKWGIQPWGKTDAVLYRVYWDEGLGGPFVLLDETSVTSYTTEALDDGTYKFRVDPVDAAGNQLTSASIATIVVLRFPDAPSDFLVTGYVVGTTTFSATWTESPTAGVTSYEVYSNGGGGAAVDYSTPVATFVAPASSGSWIETGTAGLWVHAIRAVKGALTETNVDVRHEYELGGVPLDVLGLQPATPEGLSATAIAAGKVRIDLDYPAQAEASIATLINVYYDAGTGTVDFSAPLFTIAVPTHKLGEGNVFALTAESAALVDGTTYKFAARAADAGGRESPTSNEATVIADASAPPDIGTLSVELVLATPVLEGSDA